MNKRKINKISFSFIRKGFPKKKIKCENDFLNKICCILPINYLNYLLKCILLQT